MPNDAQLSLALGDHGCQRWREKQSRFQPPSERFDPRFASVRGISAKEAAAFVQAHHYSATMPATRLNRPGFAGDNRV